MHKLLLKELKLEPIVKWARLVNTTKTSSDKPVTPKTTSASAKPTIIMLAKQVAGCQNCVLAKSRTQTVFARGEFIPGSVMVIGEAPGAQEDKQGLPFVGLAGQLLDNMLMAINLPDEKNVYITNIVKCRPPNNRDPASEEINACQPYLQQQIELLQPVLIITVGKIASHALLDTKAPVGSLRQRVHNYNNRKLVAIYHPAYLLRSPLEKRKAMEDLLFIRRTLATVG